MKGWEEDGHIFDTEIRKRLTEKSDLEQRLQEVRKEAVIVPRG